MHFPLKERERERERERDCGQQMEVAEVFSVFFKRQLRCLERGLPAKIANLTNKVIVNVNSLIISTFFFYYYRISKYGIRFEWLFTL